jgi:hypothetical protein
MTNWEFLRTFPHLWSREGKGGFATHSEKKRWLLNVAVIINGTRAVWDGPVEFPIQSMVLFPKGKRITLK